MKIIIEGNHLRALANKVSPCRLFRSSVAEVAILNAAQDDYVAEVNFMSDLVKPSSLRLSVD